MMIMIMVILVSDLGRISAHSMEYLTNGIILEMLFHRSPDERFEPSILRDLEYQS